MLAITAAAQPADVEGLLTRIATYEYGQSREPLSHFQNLRLKASPETLKALEARLLKFLQSDATPAAKNFALRELSILGTTASVPLLAGMLVKPDTAEIARYALERIPGSESAEALRKALGQTSGSVRIGIINSLGRRRDAQAIPILKPFLSSTDSNTASAAIDALAQIGSHPAFAALADARKTATGGMRERLSEALLRAGTVEVYKQLLAPEEPERIRIAALGGLAEADPKAALPPLTAALQSNTPALQTAAIRFTSGIRGAAVTAELIEQFPKLAPTGQVRLLKALGDRGDVSARPLFLSATKAASGVVRVAALSGLGKLGDASSVTVLAAAAASAQGEEQAAARMSLYRLAGPGIDEAIVNALRSAAGVEKLELVMAAGERAISGAAETLIANVTDPSPDVHREAVRALRNVAAPTHVPALLQLLDRSSTATDRKEIAQALSLVLKRSESANLQPVVLAYEKASAMPSRIALLEILGQTSADAALPLVRTSLQDSSPEIARGAVLALSEWNTPAPAPDLLAIAQASNPTLAVLALRGYLKLMALPSQRTPAESARLLGQAMTLAKQPAEKRSILSLLPSFPSKEAVAVAEAALKDEAVAKEAKLAADRLTGLLKFQ